MTSVLHEAETLHGLEPFAVNELQLNGFSVLTANIRPGGVPFLVESESTGINKLRSVTAVYRVLRFDVPRPKAFLGHQIFTTLQNVIRAIIADDTRFATLSIDAAGADSSVMVRFKNELATAVGLQAAENKGDLHLRIRKAGATGWEILVRLTPRPLATRAWRTINMPGALNAATASVMAQMTSPTPTDTIINLCCGSATLMIERAALGEFKMLYGVDNDTTALDTAREHLTTAGVDMTRLVNADATALPFAVKSFDVLLADLPFGNLVGSHADNMRFYPAFLREAARVAKKNARFALITHEKKLLSELVARSPQWVVTERVSINLNGLHPEIVLLRRG